MKLALLALLLATPAAAQRLDPDWNLTARDSRDHFLAGGGIGAGVRLLFPKARPWQRLTACATVAAAYEFGQSSATERVGPGYGWGPKDFLLTVAGCVVTEYGWRVLR